MGVADLVPGVSGGTMALILGIYPELLDSLRTLTCRSFWLSLSQLQLKQATKEVNGLFLLILVSGILCSVLFFSRQIEHLLEHHPLKIWSFFFGLVLASVVLVGQQVKHWNLGLASISFISSGMTYLLIGQVPISIPSTWWFLLLSGALAVCAMILPGISGSYILILLGQYHAVLSALNNGDVAILAPVIVGAVFGLLAFSRLLNWFFQRNPKAILASLTGFMFGSLRRIWPWQEDISADRQPIESAAVLSNELPQLLINGSLNLDVPIALLMALAGSVLVLCLSFFAQKQANPISSL